MRAAMAAAEVGDDMCGEDPTVNRLEQRLAEMLGKEAAMFAPSGTMTNQIGVRVHCQPGDEFLCETQCHIYNYEQGAFAQLSGLVARTIEGEFGVLQLDQLENLIRPGEQHQVRTRLVCLENTHNRGGGRVLPYDEIVEICAGPATTAWPRTWTARGCSTPWWPPAFRPRNGPSISTP